VHWRGPGSEFLGILKYCMLYDRTPELKCILFDREPAWSESWMDVDDKIGPSFRISTTFNLFDVTDPPSWRVYAKYLQSDLFAMVYFLSEVSIARAEAQPYFEALLTGVRAGAYFLFIDNNAVDFYDWFDDLAAAHGVEIISQGSGRETMSPSEEKKTLEPYYTKFGEPKLQMDVAYRVGVKHD